MSTATALRVISTRTIPSGSGFGSPIAPAVYRAAQRQDGTWTWRKEPGHLLGHMYGRDGRRREVGVYSAAKAERIGEGLAESMGLEFRPHIRQGSPVSAADLRAAGLLASA